MQTDEYIKRFLPDALRIEQNYGVPSGVSLGMSALESGWGVSELSKVYNNYFGMSKGSSWSGQTVARQDWYINAQGVKIYYTQYFRVYQSAQDSFNDFGKVIKSGYPKAFKYSDPVQFVNSLLTEHTWSDGKPKRYADDPEYLKKFSKVYDIIAPYIPAARVYAGFGSGILLILLMLGFAVGSKKR